MRLAVYLLLPMSLLAQISQPPMVKFNSPPIQPPSVAPQDLGRMEGVVTNQITGEPVKKATVTIQAQNGMANASATTDASGGFTIRDLPPGRYLASASHPSYVSQPYSGNKASIRQTVTLKPGEIKKGIALTVMPAASLSGQVLDADGDPVQGCQVQLMRVMVQRGRRRLLSLNAGSTNADGEYRVAQVLPGKYYVFARFRGEPVVAHPLQPVRREPSLSGEGYGPQFYPGSSDLSGATLVALTAGSETRGVDFRFKTMQVVTLRVRPTGPEGAVSPQTQVTLRPNDPLLGDDGANASYARRMPNGEFVIPYVTAGSYTLTAFTFGQQSPYVGRQQVEVGNEAPPPIALTMNNGVDITGSVELDVDQNSPLQNLHVRLEEANQQPVGHQANVALDGPAFTLPKVTPGRWRVIVDNLFGRGYVKSVRYGDQESPDGVIEVQAGAPGTLRLVVSGKGGTIEGNAQGEDSNIAGIEVTLIPEGDHVHDPSLYRTMFVAGSAQLSYSFQHLPPGKYRLFAVENSGAGLLEDTELQKALESHSESVTLEEGGRVTRTLKVITAEQMADSGKR